MTTMTMTTAPNVSFPIMAGKSISEILRNLPTVTSGLVQRGLASGSAILAVDNTASAARLTGIEGVLPDGKRLAHPLIVLIEHAEGEVVVSEPRFHIHAAGDTEREAVEAFRRIFASYLPFLEEREANLGLHLRDQLAYLRSSIVPA